MISDEYRFIFVHINKTGGTSIEKVFQSSADQMNVPFKHGTAELYRARFPRQFRNYFKFSFVRNPWDWLVSRYHWSRDHQHLIDYSFREFLHKLETRAQLSDEAAWLQEALAPQIDRLTVGGRIAVDFVGRFENLQGDFDKVCSALRIQSPRLPHVFKSEHAVYTEYFDEETRRIVERLYAKDIDAFGYRFGTELHPGAVPAQARLSSQDLSGETG